MDALSASSSIAEMIRRQIATMDCLRYEIGVYRRYANDGCGRMLLRDWDVKQLQHSLRWLRFENARGADIYIRPAGSPHQLTLVDDLSADALVSMKQAGFEPAAVLETSPNNFQAWLKHAEPLDKQTSTAVARALAEKFDGDTGAADWRHFGRLAGLENRKPSRQDIITGLFPSVRLIEASGSVYSQADFFVAEVVDKLEQLRQHQERLRVQFAAWPRSSPADMKSIEQFRSDPRYQGDGKRCDLAFAIYAFAHGADPADIEAAIRSRDLSHRGSERRQNDYVQRTMRKAIDIVGLSR